MQVPPQGRTLAISYPDLLFGVGWGGCRTWKWKGKGNGSAGGSRRKSGSKDDEDKLLGAGRMPWWFPCISGPSSVRLSLTVITALHGLQSNMRESFDASKTDNSGWLAGSVSKDTNNQSEFNTQAP